MGISDKELNNIIKIATDLGCRIKMDEPLSLYSSFRVGGKARLVVFFNSIDSIKILFKYVNENNVKYLVMGKGSNMLISDNGFDGVVFIMGRDFSKTEVLNEDTVLCEAGVPLAKLAYTAYDNSLTGLEFAWGIPGNVGGAVYMNAGAYGGEISNVILYATGIDKNGNEVKFTREELDLSYRHSVFSSDKYIITSACFSLLRGEKKAIKERMDELLKRRHDKQPLSYPSAGSTFKRPEGSYASLLIEQCGLKGLCIGGAEVSTKHSGFIINKNNANCQDVLDLIKKVQEIVFEQTGFKLECEVKIIS